MAARSPVALGRCVGVVALVCLALFAGCVGMSEPTDTPAGTPTITAPGSGPQIGEPVTDYETHVFDLSPSLDPMIAGGIEVGDEFIEQYYVTLLASGTETDRFNRSLLPADAADFVDAVSFENESLVVIQTFPASSVPDYRVETVDRDGPTLHISINDSSAGGTDDITVETLFVRVPGEIPDNVIVITEESQMFEIGGDNRSVGSR